MQKITLKPTKDLAQIIFLYKEAGWSNYLKKDPKFLEAMINSSTYCIGAFIEEELIGFIRGLSDIYAVNFIQDVVIKEKYRCQGIGSMLMKEAMEKFPQASRVVLLTDDTIIQRKFYESLGLQDINSTSSKCFLKLNDAV